MGCNPKLIFSIGFVTALMVTLSEIGPLNKYTYILPVHR